MAVGAVRARAKEMAWGEVGREMEGSLYISVTTCNYAGQGRKWSRAGRVLAGEKHIVDIVSTRLRYGYRVQLEPSGVLGFVARVRETMGEVYRDSYRRLVAEHATKYADAWLRGEHFILLGNRNLSEHALLDGVRTLDIVKWSVDGTGHRDPVADLSLEIVFLADEGGDENMVYALVYAERGEYRVAFEAMPEVEWYPYWNDVDRPNDVSETEWDARRATWGRLLGGFNDAPATRGVTWSLLGEGHTEGYVVLHHPEVLNDYLPSKEERGLAIGMRAAVAHMDAVRDEPLVRDDGEMDLPRVLRTLSSEREERQRLAEDLGRAVEGGLVDLTGPDLLDLSGFNRTGV